MARESVDNWLIVEKGDVAIQGLVGTSVMEAIGRPEPMATTTKDVPRSGDFAIAGIAKGGTYGETSGTNDYVELIGKKVGGAARFAEEDLDEGPVAVLATKRKDAARNMAKFFDNATLGTSAAISGVTVPFTSAYRALRTNDATVGYTADDNYSSGAVTYDNLSNALGLVEVSDFFDEGEIVVIAHPAYKKSLRGIKDDDGDPIFFQARAGEGTPSTLFEYPIYWSLGAKVSSTATYAPTGNPLLYVANRQLLIKGMARLSPKIASSNPGWAVQNALNGIGFLSDETLMKMAMRRAFVVGDPRGVAVFEKTS